MGGVAGRPASYLLRRVAFFERIVAEAGVSEGEILSVGDRQDVDVRPAAKVGLQVALVRRGPWGRILDDPEILDSCLFTVPDLTSLPELVRQHNLREVTR
jgi:FMN phosphatase YigB (HAD superfamily)